MFQSGTCFRLKRGGVSNNHPTHRVIALTLDPGGFGPRNRFQPRRSATDLSDEPRRSTGVLGDRRSLAGRPAWDPSSWVSGPTAKWNSRPAIKFVSDVAHGPFRDRFLRERQILASLSHPGIARLLDAGPEPVPPSARSTAPNPAGSPRRAHRPRTTVAAGAPLGESNTSPCRRRNARKCLHNNHRGSRLTNMGSRTL
jgi:hypothetical protein